MSGGTEAPGLGLVAGAALDGAVLGLGLVAAAVGDAADDALAEADGLGLLVQPAANASAANATAVSCAVGLLFMSVFSP
jgi:hypothetical protein